MYQENAAVTIKKEKTFKPPQTQDTAVINEPMKCGVSGLVMHVQSCFISSPFLVRL